MIDKPDFIIYIVHQAHTKDGLNGSGFYIDLQINYYPVDG